MSNTARQVLWPNNSNILVRVAMLHAGQGDSSIVFVADGATYQTILVDCNLDGECGGLDIPRLIEDLVGSDGLDVFVNTHPHDDHIRGIKDVADRVNIGAVWHSGHKPSRKYGKAYYDELEPLIRAVVKDGGEEIVLQGSREQQSIAEAHYYVLSPAEYVTDEVNETAADSRYRRIHEQCAVLKFGTGESWIILPGDADRDAFEKHITEYHKDRLGSLVLSASHHGSRTFFRYDKADDAYMEGLNAIDPEYVVVPAPRQSESPHDHPHDDAMKMYEEHVGSDNVLHTGENRYCFICDIYRDGSYSGVIDDKGELVDAYPLGDGDDGGKVAASVAVGVPAVRTRVDDRPMGSTARCDGK